MMDVVPGSLTPSDAPTGSPVSLSVGEDGLAWLTLEGPGPYLTARLRAALDAQLDAVEPMIAEERVRAVVLRRSGRGPFLAGEDPNELLAVEGVAEATARALSAQGTLRRLEELGAPTIAAMEGPCYGAGLELALACATRVASSADLVRFALPQVRLGIIPGLGATVRLPRLIGLQESIRLILTTETVAGPEALTLGLVDAILPASTFRAEVEGFALHLAARRRVRAGIRRPVARRLFDDTAPGRRLVLARAARGLIPRLPHPPGALRQALQSIAEGIAHPLDLAFAREAELYAQLLVSDSARAALHAATLTDAPAADVVPPGPIRNAAVLGCGSRGSELALVLAQAGVPVRLKDRKRSTVAASVEAVRDRLGSRVASRADLEELVGGAAGFGGFGTVELVAAAVGDRPAILAAALAEAERHVSDRCFLATTTPLVPVAEVGAGLHDPSRLIGLIFPSPAEPFPLLEIAAGPESSPDAVAAGRLLARRLGRTPLLVADRPGFLLHSLLAALFAEAVALIDDGAGVEAVDAAMERHGYRLGPLARIDAIGADRVARLMARLGRAPAPESALSRMARDGGHFYRYRAGRAIGPARAHAGDARGRELPGGFGALERLSAALLNEAARQLEAGTVAAPGELDRAVILGLGFPYARGGLLFQADREGVAAMAARLDELADTLGERFRPAPMLRHLGERDAGFYPPPRARLDSPAARVIS